MAFDFICWNPTGGKLFWEVCLLEKCFPGQLYGPSWEILHGRLRPDWSL